eukprot:359365-Chlamydomonas_euryale.AAC.5
MNALRASSGGCGADLRCGGSTRHGRLLRSEPRASPRPHSGECCGSVAFTRRTDKPAITLPRCIA